MGKENKRFYSILIRYALLILLGLSLPVFYFIFTPLTVYPVYYLLDLLFNPILEGTIIGLEGHTIYLVKACIAGSAYFLLSILNLSTPMKPGKRVYSLLFLFATFLFINILRIFGFSLILLNSFSLFNTLHLITWYFLSGVIVFLVWISAIKLFRIGKTPFYSDFRFLLGVIKK